MHFDTYMMCSRRDCKVNFHSLKYTQRVSTIPVVSSHRVSSHKVCSHQYKYMKYVYSPFFSAKASGRISARVLWTPRCATLPGAFLPGLATFGTWYSGKKNANSLKHTHAITVIIFKTYLLLTRKIIKAQYNKLNCK